MGPTDRSDTRAADHNQIYLAAACNQRYAMPLAVMLVSAGATLAPGRELVAYVLESDLGPTIKAKIEKSIQDLPISLRWLSIDPAPLEELKKGFRSFDWFTIEIYYRLLLPFVLGDNICKIIYLDCDTVLNHDLGELWDVEIGDAYALAIPEADPKGLLVSSPKGVRFYQELGLNPSLKFFNSGVLVINLRRWRRDNLPFRVATYLREAGDEVLWYDQEALNAAMSGEWTEVDPRWNFMMQFQGRGEAEHRGVSPYLIHFTGATKPWHADYQGGFRSLFFEYLDRTAWSGWRPRQPATARVTGIARLAIKAVRKRRHGLSRFMVRRQQKRHAEQVLRQPLTQLDPHPIPDSAPKEIRLFVVGDTSGPDLPDLVDHHLCVGCDRAFLALSGVQAGDWRLIERDARVHRFSRAGDSRSDHEVLQTLLNLHGREHWCVIVGPNETLASCGPTKPLLIEMCAQMQAQGLGALRCLVMERCDVPGSKPWLHPSHNDVPKREDLQRIRTIVRDPLTQRVFGATIDHASGAPWIVGEVESPTKIVLLRYRPDISIAQDLRAVSGCREATDRGVLLRFHRPA